MADAGSEDLERQALLAFLEAQRTSVLAIVEGLGEEALRTPAAPSGWTPWASFSISDSLSATGSSG